MVPRQGRNGQGPSLPRAAVEETEEVALDLLLKLLLALKLSKNLPSHLSSPRILPPQSPYHHNLGTVEVEPPIELVLEQEQKVEEDVRAALRLAEEVVVCWRVTCWRLLVLV